MTQDPVLGRRVWSDRQLRQRLSEDEARAAEQSDSGGSGSSPSLIKTRESADGNGLPIAAGASVDMPLALHSAASPDFSFSNDGLQVTINRAGMLLISGDFASDSNVDNQVFLNVNVNAVNTAGATIQNAQSDSKIPTGFVPVAQGDVLTQAVINNGSDNIFYCALRLGLV